MEVGTGRPLKWTPEQKLPLVLGALRGKAKWPRSAADAMPETAYFGPDLAPVDEPRQ